MPAQAEHPEAKGVVEVIKACGTAWSQLGEEDKAPYVARALEESIKYFKAKQEYVLSSTTRQEIDP